ncbi:AAA family ATPase [Leptotrichia trevisanii]|uniref:AAA family ATPase n=1 Tax=Leptotrichia trevisanii TaxID=109328 RepID=UPI0004162274|nr:AAA family ATPase [Leptotrichia trevisanii]
MVDKEMMEKNTRNRKPLPIGVSDFKEIVENNYYYIDKTKLIEDILHYRAKVNLFTRPRRFGKTLNMSMIKYFFDIEKKEENRKLFDELNISKSEYMQEQGQYPVIYISFRNMEEVSWENSYIAIRQLISNMYDEFKFIREDMDERELFYFDNVWFNKDTADWKGSLKALTKYLYEYYGKKAIVLIDEYDTPIIQAYQEGYYKQAISFFKKFYGDAMKDNEYLQFGIMTGILRIAKEGIFSGLNNLKVNNIFSEKYSEYYGLTENEVVKAVKYYGLEYEMEDIKEWYNGYQFGDSQVYNPWSIINFLDEKKLCPYWIGVSGNKLIDDMLDKGNEKILSDLEKLFRGERIHKQINDYTEFTFGVEDIWQLFLYSGYLTTSGKFESGECPIKIPNREITEFFENRFINRFIGNYNKFSDIIRNLKNGKIEEFAKELQDEILSSLSYFDTEKDEKYYKIFLIGIFIILGNDYIRLSERESGYGRADLVLEPKNKINPAYIFEFKVVNNEDELENYAKAGFEQIKEKEYDVELRNRGVGRIVCVGLAFYRKKLKMKYEIME